MHLFNCKPKMHVSCTSSCNYFLTNFFDHDYSIWQTVRRNRTVPNRICSRTYPPISPKTHILYIIFSAEHPLSVSDSYSSTYFGQMMSTYCREHVIDTLDKMRRVIKQKLGLIKNHKSNLKKLKLGNYPKSILALPSLFIKFKFILK